MNVDKNLKVALVCDWLIGIGGAERLFLELHKMFPNAPIYTSQYDPKKIDWFDDAEVHTLWLQKLPKSLRKFLPVFRGRAFHKLDLSEYDLVISMTGAEAKSVKTGPKTLHICYCNAPTHYYWSRYEQYLKDPGFGVFDPLARFGLKLFVGPLRKFDYKMGQNPDYMIGNSKHIAAEIKKYYGRTVPHIYPPVNIERFKPKTKIERKGLVVAGRQTPYKRIDLAVAACTKLNLPLIVVGDGPEHDKLVSMAGPSIKFVGQAPDEDVVKYFQASEALIFPTRYEDFGITAVEALAAGTPVIAFNGGGPAEYIEPGKNGLLFNDQAVDSLVQALQKFDAKDFDQKTVEASAEQFSNEHFKKQIENFVEKCLDESKKSQSTS